MVFDWKFEPPSCLGKTKYETPADAHKVMAKRGRKAKDGRGAFRVYGCDACKGYHIGALAIKHAGSKYEKGYQ